ncbi:hypothetical protein I317_00113 [Kwoniella heveanensis CBS 569]|uniref:rRNA-processing protein EFG1 n=1 Tax=Kwoniella heveanensis BCC8398 TaxID=1296120 RepID=A0A1B9H1L9_9TREE|nr:hypothetical protein I316_01070 [Kwoniella heveanensis BCC8398]OCF46025.1 hypothetical protein I317_00113 [Kwoniella heveanensis CBS 569]
MPVTHKNRNRNQAKNPYRKPKPADGNNDKPRPGHKIPSTQERSADALPGLSKIKASIRQTKRLLAKDNLEPGLRVQTQRRLTSLEADLANAEKREVEKKNGAKYHMVKFFDRQKLLRIIKRLNKKVGKAGDDGPSAKIEEELQDARVMLNYVLNFPNTEKYISLFPSSASANGHGNAATTSTTTESDKDQDGAKLKLPPLLRSESGGPDALDKPSQRRLEILRQIQSLMSEGKLSNTPEEEVKKEGGSGAAGGRRHHDGAVKVGVDVAADGEGGAEVPSGKKSKKGKGGAAAAREEKVEEDDFFESD